MHFNVSAIHSDLEQDERNEVLRNFKIKTLKILVATDILSRGIDIDSIGLVVNYDVPRDAYMTPLSMLKEHLAKAVVDIKVAKVAAVVKASFRVDIRKEVN